MTSLDSYLEQFAPALGRRCAEQLRPLHTPMRAPHRRLGELLRPPFPAQAHAITALARLWDEQKAGLLVAEMGTGKTLQAMGAVHCHADGKPYRALVFCPGQLVLKWKRELEQTLPGVHVTIIESWRDVTPLIGLRGVRPAVPTWYVIARDRAKLGARWKGAFATRRRPVQSGEATAIVKMPSCPGCGQPIADENGHLLSAEALDDKMHWCPTCGAALWSYTSDLRRWAPATLIHKKLKKFFDYLIVDEAHEEKSATSAQANAVGSLAAAAKRCLALTGTLLGGYAEHIRPLLFRLNPRSVVEEGFAWDEVLRFAERYGRIKTTIREKESDGSRNRQSRGSSRSVSRSIEPGIHPALFGDHLLDKAVFLRLDEIASALPPYQEKVIPIEMEGSQAIAYKDMEKDLMAAVRQLLAMGNRQLLGTMVNALLYYPDSAYGEWAPLGYHQRSAFITVHIPARLDDKVIYPKEQALIDYCLGERKRGRQSWVYVQLTEKYGVLERLKRLLSEAGLKVEVLKASVELAKREAWIARHAVGKDVILSHPKLVETGLDLFDKEGSYNFPSIAFYETGYSLFTLRQAARRAWRIGQQQPCEVAFFYYHGTMQARALSLMGRKLAAAEAIDGKFSSEGLVAAADDDGSLETALAKSLVEKIGEDPARLWAKIGEEAPAVIPFKQPFQDRTRLDDMAAKHARLKAWLAARKGGN